MEIIISLFIGMVCFMFGFFMGSVYKPKKQKAKFETDFFSIKV